MHGIVCWSVVAPLPLNLAQCRSATSSETAPVVKLAFLGVPFAAPPTGPGIGNRQ